MRLRRHLGLIGSAVLLTTGPLVGCSGKQTGSAPAPGGGEPAAGQPTSSDHRGEPTLPAPTPTVAGEVATGLTSPWGLTFEPDGAALVSERDTALIKRIRPGGKVTVVGQVPGVVPGGEGGLLGLAVSPRYATDKLLYAFFSAATENRVVRMKVEGNRLGPPHTILAGLDRAQIHNGGRLLFGPDGMLYVGTGEAGKRTPAQNRAALNGKILRLTPDGEPAPDNPFGTAVYSLGHRNPQGLAFDSDGRLWASEFGQNTWDELNLIQPGRNYGWPLAEGRTGRAGLVSPKTQWTTAEASPSGIAVLGKAVYMAGLRGERLWQIPLDGERTGKPRAFFTGRFGRLRTVAKAPDGSLWLTTSNTDKRGHPRPGDDRILRLTVPLVYG